MRHSTAVAPSAGTQIGTVTHWYSQVEAAIVRIDSGELRVGDRVRFEGATTNFEDRIDRMELDRQPIEVAYPGQVVGLHARERVREHDRVIKLPRN